MIHIERDISEKEKDKKKKKRMESDDFVVSPQNLGDASSDSMGGNFTCLNATGELLFGKKSGLGNFYSLPLFRIKFNTII